MDFRAFLAVSLFLFGSTFLWMTAAMSGKTPPPVGTAWTGTNLLAYAAILLFTVAAWGVFKEYSWWPGAVVASGAVGLVAVVSFVLAQRQLDTGLGDGGVQINLWMHLLGSAGVMALVLLAPLHGWVTRHL